MQPRLQKFVLWMDSWKSSWSFSERQQPHQIQTGLNRVTGIKVSLFYFIFFLLCFYLFISILRPLSIISSVKHSDRRQNQNLQGILGHNPSPDLAGPLLPLLCMCGLLAGCIWFKKTSLPKAGRLLLGMIGSPPCHRPVDMEDSDSTRTKPNPSSNPLGFI